MAEYLEGTIERITFQAEDTGYIVARLLPRGYLSGLVTVVGVMAAAQAGESFRFEGDWTNHPRYGRQFKFTSYSSMAPTTEEGIKRYLGSGLIKGIGPGTAGKLVKHFGLETLDIIEDEPDRILEVPGIGPKRAEMIKQGWETQKKIKDVMVFLHTHGVSTTYAVKIYKQYGDEAISLVSENPYRLERDIWGVGFLTADRIARDMGFGINHTERIKAGICYALNVSSEAGHVFLPKEELLRETAQLLQVEPSLLPTGLEHMIEEKEIIEDGAWIYLSYLYHSEVGIVESLRRILDEEVLYPIEGIDEAMVKLERQFAIRYEKVQKEGIRKAVESKVMILTGGPGTGKTTITRGIIGLFEEEGMKVLLCSPTGRAAKKLAEATGREAKTIHRMLGYSPKGGFRRNRNNPLETDAVIVDEVSMVDTVLMYSLLRAIPDHAVIILVGDVDQLPSVGAGNVLKDLIDSGVLPLVRLTHIFRQAQQSQIVVNAHRINEGQFPYIDPEKARDFLFIEEEDPDHIVEVIQQLCAETLPERYGYNAIEDVQVISPMYRGETGVTSLNRVLQQSLNPDGAQWQRGDTVYRIGDKVMQIRNNYDKGVFNGDIGRITAIDLEEQTVEVLFDEVVLYEFSEMDELVLAYAISVHKSQGSEYKAVVMPLTAQHYMMLQRNLLYTAVTRARELVVIVGTKKALSIAVNNDKITQRHPGLADRLRQAVTS